MPRLQVPGPATCRRGIVRASVFYTTPTDFRKRQAPSGSCGSFLAGRVDRVVVLELDVPRHAEHAVAVGPEPLLPVVARTNLFVYLVELEARVLQSPSPRVVGNVQSLWKRLAERQRRVCAVSQRENARLLRDVQRCADWIERLWVLLRETRQIDDLARDAHRNIRARDAAVLAELKHDVAPRTAWASAYTTFQAHGFCLGTSPDALDDRWSRTIESTGRRCSLVVARHLPFDALATSAALWSSLAVVGHSVTHGRSHDNGHTVVLERSQTACAMTYKIDDSLILGDDKPMIRCHAVVQTVVARGEARDKACDALVANCATLFAWHSISSASSRLHSASPSARDTMWVAVSTSADGTGGSTVWIVAESQLDELPSTMPTLLESMLRATEYCVTEMLETAENALMDTLQSRRDRLATSDGIAEGCTV